MVSYRTVLLFWQAPSDHHHHHHQEKPRRSTTSNHLMETISPDCSCKTYNYHYITGSKSAWLATERVARVPLCCQFPGFLHHQCTVQNPEQGKMFFNCSRVSSVTPPDLRMRLPEHDKSAFSPGSGYFHSSGGFLFGAADSPPQAWVTLLLLCLLWDWGSGRQLTALKLCSANADWYKVLAITAFVRNQLEAQIAFQKKGYMEECTFQRLGWNSMLVSFDKFVLLTWCTQLVNSSIWCLYNLRGFLAFERRVLHVLTKQASVTISFHKRQV